MYSETAARLPHLSLKFPPEIDPIHSGLYLCKVKGKRTYLTFRYWNNDTQKWYYWGSFTESSNLPIKPLCGPTGLISWQGLNHAS